MKEKRKNSSVNPYTIVKAICIVTVVICIVMFLITMDASIISIAIAWSSTAILCQDLLEKQYVIECFYRTVEIRNERISMLNEEKMVLIEKVEECQKQLISEMQQRASAERKMKRMKKQMEQAGILYVSSDTKRKDTIPRKRRSKNNETNNKAN